MKTRAASCNVPSQASNSNLFIPVPDTEFHDFLLEIDELIDFTPGILTAVEKDLDAYGKKKKKVRLEDKQFYENLTADLPQLKIEECPLLEDELYLNVGRPRISAHLVYVFLMIRGYLGSLTSKEARIFLRESMSLYDFLDKRGYTLPASTTIVENVNAVSEKTRELIFDKQICSILNEGLDDFKKLFIDSTAVKANSAWPTDAKVVTELLRRAHKLGQKLEMFNLPNFRAGWMENWLKTMKALTFNINMTARKPKSKGKRKQYYRRLLKTARKAAAHLEKEVERFEKEQTRIEYLAPSRVELLERVLEQIKTDLTDAYRVIKYAGDRVFHEKKLVSTEKVLSLSDKSAAFIKKGGRNPVIGYKPQIGRSGNGFVSSLIVPEGNASDSGKLVEMTIEAISHTGVIPKMVSVDDGYASKDGKDELEGMGIKVVSIGGAKGKKLTTEEDWNSKEYIEARRERSAVESLIFTIKHGFSFGTLGRRGQEAVRAELLEKVAAYNFCRMIALRRAQKRPKLKRVA